MNKIQAFGAAKKPLKIGITMAHSSDRGTANDIAQSMAKAYPGQFFGVQYESGNVSKLYRLVMERV